MSGRGDTNNQVNVIGSTGNFENGYDLVQISSYRNVVRPVVELYTCALDNSCKKEINEVNSKQDIKNNEINKNDYKEIVKVPNTLQKISILLIVFGVMSILLSLITLIKNRKIIKMKK